MYIQHLGGGVTGCSIRRRGRGQGRGQGRGGGEGDVTHSHRPSFMDPRTHWVVEWHRGGYTGVQMERGDEVTISLAPWGHEVDLVIL